MRWKPAVGVHVCCILAAGRNAEAMKMYMKMSINMCVDREHVRHYVKNKTRDVWWTPEEAADQLFAIGSKVNKTTKEAFHSVAEYVEPGIVTAISIHACIWPVEWKGSALLSEDKVAQMPLSRLNMRRRPSFKMYRTALSRTGTAKATATPRMLVTGMHSSRKNERARTTMLLVYIVYYSLAQADVHVCDLDGHGIDGPALHTDGQHVMLSGQHTASGPGQHPQLSDASLQHVSPSGHAAVALQTTSQAPPPSECECGVGGGGAGGGDGGDGDGDGGEGESQTWQSLQPHLPHLEHEQFRMCPAPPTQLQIGGCSVEHVTAWHR